MYKTYYNSTYNNITYYKKDRIYMQFSQVFLGLLMSLLTLISILTFKAAHCAVSNSPSDSNDDRRNKLILKKKIRLSIMFLLMFIIFNFGFIPVVVAAETTHYLYASQQALLLAPCLTSVLNPLLVLCFTKTFRVKRGQDRGQENGQERDQERDQYQEIRQENGQERGQENGQKRGRENGQEGGQCPHLIGMVQIVSHTRNKVKRETDMPV